MDNLRIKFNYTKPTSKKGYAMQNSIKCFCLLIVIFTGSCTDESFFIDEIPDSDIIDDFDTNWPLKHNAYSWDGSWEPTSDDFPIDGLYDEIYFDGHTVEGEASPILPPGKWDWNITSLLANWRGFSNSVGDFDLLVDFSNQEFGWRLNRNVITGVDVTSHLELFYGSPGTDIIDLGLQGSFSSAGNPMYGDPVNFGDGPDMLRFRHSHSAAVRTGSSATGHQHDNDLVIIGSAEVLNPGVYDIMTTSIHTGPGNDLIFVNNWERAAIDAGNGNDGRTDALDTYDGTDIVVIGGNARDFRVFGGNGGDLFVWHVDEVNQQPNTWLGPNFFGGGAWGNALWSDTGIDRLVLGIPSNTRIVTSPGDVEQGTLLVMIGHNYETVIDDPTTHDETARYYITAPPGPDGQKTMTLQYISISGHVNTAYFYITDIEELQIGVGNDARVFQLDDVEGTATLNATIDAITNIPSRNSFTILMDSFLK